MLNPSFSGNCCNSSRDFNFHFDECSCVARPGILTSLPIVQLRSFRSRFEKKYVSFGSPHRQKEPYSSLPMIIQETCGTCNASVSELRMWQHLLLVVPMQLNEISAFSSAAHADCKAALLERSSTMISVSLGWPRQADLLPIKSTWS